jgi:plasmid rolling circle replication initiator protein Rep
MLALTLAPSTADVEGDRPVCLFEVSEKDGKWDDFHQQSQKIADLYSGTSLNCYSQRIRYCCPNLIFNGEPDSETGETKFKLSSARFCRVSRCPICDWRRSLMWRSKAFKIFPKVFEAYPKAKYLFLTLTVKNCPIQDLRSTLRMMNKSWERFSKLKQFPAIGWMRSTEVTRAYDCVSQSWCVNNGAAKPCNRCIPQSFVHPHFHCLLMVNPGYFTGASYLSHEKWRDMWQQSARLDYEPQVNIKANQGMLDSVLETFKYSIKTADILRDESPNASMTNSEFLVELTQQLHKMRLVNTGGILKQYLQELENDADDLIHADNLLDDELTSKSVSLTFTWNEWIKHYSHSANSN